MTKVKYVGECRVCETETEFTLTDPKNLPQDFEIRCPNCGNSPVQVRLVNYHGSKS